MMVAYSFLQSDKMNRSFGSAFCFKWRKMPPSRICIFETYVGVNM